MTGKLPTRVLRERPDLSQLKRQAKALLDAYHAGDDAARAEVHSYFRVTEGERFALHDAQLVLARSYGFDSWPRLKAHVDGITTAHLVEAVEQRRIDDVRAMLAIQPDLADRQLTYGDERRPLHFAVMRRQPDMVRLLMRHGANARAGVHPHREATSAWTMASDRGDEEIVAIIEEEEARRAANAERRNTSTGPGRGAEVPTPQASSDAITPVSAAATGNIAWLRARHAEGRLVNPIDWSHGGMLTAAVDHDRADVLAWLLDAGFDPDERVRWRDGPETTSSQAYPLWHCAATGKIAMAEMLLRHGADPNAHVDSSGSPVYAAISQRQWAVVDLLLRHGGIVTADIAGLYRRTDDAARLLEEASAAAPPDPERVARVAAELLEYAASGGGDDIVRLALRHIDWPRDDPRWFRMLTRSFDFWNHIPWLSTTHGELDRRTYVTCCQLILDRSDPNIVGGFGRTALHEVAALGDHVTADEAVTIAKLLLDAGACLDVRDTLLESTPLAWACRWGRRELVTLFLSRGADPIERNTPAWATPIAWAQRRDDAQTIRMLNRGAWP